MFFDTWFEKVTSEMNDMYNVTPADLPARWSYYESFNEGVSPKDTATAAYNNAMDK